MVFRYSEDVLVGVDMEVLGGGDGEQCGYTAVDGKQAGLGRDRDVDVQSEVAVAQGERAMRAS